MHVNLFCGVELLSTVERHTRGGLCCLGSNRDVKVNHIAQTMTHQVPSYLMHLDMNNLHGATMTQNRLYTSP